MRKIDNSDNKRTELNMGNTISSKDITLPALSLFEGTDVGCLP